MRAKFAFQQIIIPEIIDRKEKRKIVYRGHFYCMELIQVIKLVLVAFLKIVLYPEGKEDSMVDSN